jgi:hypothetical protein
MRLGDDSLSHGETCRHETHEAHEAHEGAFMKTKIIFVTFVIIVPTPQARVSEHRL